MSRLNTIEECVFDVYFESDAVAENFLGIISQVDGFENITKLPLYQIPEAARKNDPNLKFQPLYEIKSKTKVEYKIMLGDNTIGLSLSGAGKYSSWTESFFPEIQKLFSTIISNGKINKITRIGLRYVDFIESENIFEDGKVTVNINDHDATQKKMFLRIEDSIDEISYVKTVTNKVQYKAFPNLGSIIDIITFIDSKDFILDGSFDLAAFFTNIDSLHTVHTDKFKEVISSGRIEQYGI